ncbi:hypothetical protein [uncultured Draconibacterium sp.]|uniref:hypothetical protein n=1 Tax=uncultured Draconibacterium sp. TaxID=1573823 RepID=UPI0032165843
MRRVSVNSKMEITRMELVDTKFINNRGNAISAHLVPETINTRMFVELFTELKYQDLFAQKIFSRN